MAKYCFLFRIRRCSVRPGRTCLSWWEWCCCTAVCLLWRIALLCWWGAFASKIEECTLKFLASLNWGTATCGGWSSGKTTSWGDCLVFTDTLHTITSWKLQNLLYPAFSKFSCFLYRFSSSDLSSTLDRSPSKSSTSVRSSVVFCDELALKAFILFSLTHLTTIQWL